jgi:hypothetical protein
MGSPLASIDEYRHVEWGKGGIGGYLQGGAAALGEGVLGTVVGGASAIGGLAEGAWHGVENVGEAIWDWL